MKPIFIVTAMMLALVGTARAQTSGDIAVQSVWARATPPGAKTGAVYLMLMNRGGTVDQLVGVTTPVAAMAGIHTEIMDHDVMKMRPLKSVDIAPGGGATLKPGGMHIMLMGLKHPLRRGDHFPLTLQFAHAPALTVQVDIAKVGASMPDMGDRHH
ncbi:MAG TPA: copper chaperone PCu(A)C [Pseudolabrys sp.]